MYLYVFDFDLVSSLHVFSCVSFFDGFGKQGACIYLCFILDEFGEQAACMQVFHFYGFGEQATCICMCFIFDGFG